MTRDCRVMVFIDGQNVHRDFRRAFVRDQNAPSRVGSFNPMALAKLLASRGPEFERWDLAGVRAYVGSPVASRQPAAAAAHDRQMEAWRHAGVVPMPRPLYYPPEWPRERERQKGVDVELAVDVVRMAIAGEYQIGIIVSTDRDLLPAIEAVYKLRGTEAVPRICVVRYAGLNKRLHFRDAGGRTLHAFEITEADFRAVADDTDYRDGNLDPAASTVTLSMA